MKHEYLRLMADRLAVARNMRVPGANPGRPSNMQAQGSNSARTEQLSKVNCAAGIICKNPPPLK